MNGERPVFGSERYHRQVETIFTVCSSAEDRIQANQMVLMYILDESFHRAAISEALKMLDKHFEENSQ